MALTVNSAFEEFNKNHVNLTIGNSSTGRSSRDWLIGQLNSLPQKVDAFPRLYSEKHIKFGSFARNTKIKPLDDIDLLLVFDAGEATYSPPNAMSTKYKINTSTAVQELVNLSDNGKLNSIKLVNKIVSALKKIEQYKSADIHRRQEAATLNLLSYEWNFDIVPSFYTVKQFYLVPDGEGDWKATDPRIDQKRVTDINQKHDGKILQIIRTLKYWNRRASMPTISSYLFENLVLRYFENRTRVGDYIDLNMRDFYEHLQNAIYSSLYDPKGFQGDLNTLTLEEKDKISIRAKDAFNKAREAQYFEMTLGDNKKAIDKWKEVFGNDFPAYG